MGTGGEYFKGYIAVIINGLNPEKFINMASKNNIVMWDIVRIDLTTIEFKMNQEQFKSLKSIALRTKCNVKIRRKYGLSFLLYKLEKRKFFILGICVFFAILIYLSSAIWRIQIYGIKMVQRNVLFESLNNAGLKPGVLKKRINIRDVEDKVIKDIDEVGIINITFIGTTAKVEVVERSMPPKIIPTNIPSNIIASKEGIITKIFAFKGQKAVSEGDIVKKDQLLISGRIIDNENNVIDVVHSIGTVMAKTWYEEICEVPLKYVYQERTGRFKKKVYLEALDKKLCIKNDNIDFEKYDRIEEKTNLQIKGNKLPATKIEEFYFEKIDIVKNLTTEEAIEIGIQKVEERIKDQITEDIKIIDKKIDKKIENDKIIVRLLYVAEENICKEEEIK